MNSTHMTPPEPQFRPGGGEVKVGDPSDVTNYSNQGFEARKYNFEDINSPPKDERRKSYGGSRRRRPSRKYKKSKRVFRKKSRSTRRR
jgi:hypothetical protein